MDNLAHMRNCPGVQGRLKRLYICCSVKVNMTLPNAPFV